MNRSVRTRFTKTGKVRFTSHRDVARIWERGLRRAGLPVAYTQGFSPRPKLSFGFALPTGCESLGEYLDISLRDEAMHGDDEDVVCQRLGGSLDPVLPQGMEVQAAVPLPPGAMSLQQAVTSCTWHIRLAAAVSPSVARAAVDRVLAAPELPLTRERKGGMVTDDIRPGILHLQVRESVLRCEGPAASPSTSVDPSTTVGGIALEAELATQPRAVRPADLVDALGRGFEADRVVRIHQWTQAGGARREVIPVRLAATPARTLEARAS
jgi:radical SAM-linked protein